MRISPIIEVEELIHIYKNPNVLIFDVRNGIDAKTNYTQEHLEGAIFIDLNTQLAEIKDNFANGGRHPLPQLSHFSMTLRDVGITKDSHLILYDDKNGSNAAARFWWMLKSIGHLNVQVLNGGIQHAIRKKFPTSSEPVDVKPVIDPYPIKEWYLPTIEMNTLENLLHNSKYLIVDVRDKERYDGKTETMDVIAGHIPSAVNIPFTENLDSNGLFLKPDELRQKYELQFGTIYPKNIIIHCGSGVTACHTLLALDYAEMEIPRLYVGSWSEWSRNNKMVETIADSK